MRNYRARFSHPSHAVPITPARPCAVAHQAASVISTCRRSASSPESISAWLTTAATSVRETRAAKGDAHYGSPMPAPSIALRRGMLRAGRLADRHDQPVSSATAMKLPALQAALRVAPAQQCLGADQFATLQIDARVVVRLKLAASSARRSPASICSPASTSAFMRGSNNCTLPRPRDLANDKAASACATAFRGSRRRSETSRRRR